MPEMTPEEEALWKQSDEELESSTSANATFDEEEEEAEQPEQLEEEEPEADEEEEAEDNSETPEEQDSDDDTADEDETEEESTDEVEEPEVVEKEEAKAESDLRPVRANGVDIPVKNIDEVYQMASMGADYKRKMADIAPYRRSISAMKENGVSESDINTFIDMKKGSKEALQTFVKELGIDPLDIDTEANHEYIPKEYGVDESASALNDVIDVISKDEEYQTTQRVVDIEWDSESRKVLAQNPQMVRGLHEEIKKGAYAKVAPEALRLEILDNGKKSKLDYYLAAEKLYYEAENAKIERTNIVQSEQKAKTVQKKRAASPTRSKATSSKSTEPDFAKMSDEDYDKFYNETMRS